IGQEFIEYVNGQRAPDIEDQPFMKELIHYEWVELALDISTLEIPAKRAPVGNLIDNIPLISPTAWRFVYQYPVHKLGPSYQPAASQAETAALIIYRNRDLHIGFMESNVLTIRLLDIIEPQQCSGREAIVKLAREIDHLEPDNLVEFGADILWQLYHREIISGFQPI
ncbi:MAG: DNA-binding domain-containing protein, partial [Porticoccaceae bacterium]